MGDQGDPTERDPMEPPSLEQVVRLDTFLDALVHDQNQGGDGLSEQELRERLVAAQLRMAREDEVQASPAFLQALEQAVGQAVGQQGRPRRLALNRKGFLRTAATFVGGAGLGVAGAEGVAAAQDMQQGPHELIVAGNERWYAIARVGELPRGGVKSFSAGGLLGFLLNDGGRLHAVSAICTHMGCRLKPDPAAGALHCLCHGSRFNRHGDVVQGRARASLPAIALRKENGIVYAKGTRETV